MTSTNAASIPSTRGEILSCHKRKHAELSSLDDASELQPSKRHQSQIQLHSSSFYDSLSKVWLTRRALKELDHRTKLLGRAQPSAQATHSPPQIHASKHIQQFARHGGPELHDLRGYPFPLDYDLAYNMSSRRSARCSSSSGSKRSSTVPTSTSKSRKSSAYDNDFQQHLIDNRIYPEGYDYPDGRQTPEPNMEAFNGMLAQPRPSLSPSCFSTSDFRAFKQANARVISEGKVMSTVLPAVYGKSEIPNEGDLVFTRLDPIANDTTVDAKPDFYDGVRLEDLHKKVQYDLGAVIIPTGHSKAPVAPNFFLEAKAPNGAADVVKRQACYNGALGARGMHQLQCYSQDKPLYDGNAYTVTSTYHAGTGTLQMYTTHPTESLDHTPEYHMTQVRAWALTSDVESFRQGATAFRNARHWAKGQRDSLIASANEHAKIVSANPLLPTTSTGNDVPYATTVEDETRLAHTEDLPSDLQQSTEHAIHQEVSVPEPSNRHALPNATSRDGAEGSDTSADELAIDTEDAVTNKRRNKTTSKNTSKSLRNNYGTRRKRRSKA